ncbi:iroquois-class homeodomain protein IRX-1b isoform X2 [Oreochromis aureus]|uniref:iroquois-class homeodomain protein IRX-1b isoform X2 n=1 Tax=Oreochromis aureus TaxID=47969 RepID=UPI00195430AB|nr:iroquois-class homeodomain protein IRX-1b isoform X2 [Oreochromis aureus]
MSFPQLGYPQFLSASHEVYGGDRPGSAREGTTEGGVSSSATAAAVGSMLGMYGSPWAAHNYSAFLPYSGATDLALISQMVSTWFANARRRLKKENKVTWGRSAEDRDGRIFSSDNEDEHEHGKNGSDDEDEEEEIDLETVDIERPEEQREGERGSARGEAEAGLSAAEQASESKSSESSRTLSAEALRGAEAGVSLGKSPSVKLPAEHSPGRQECQRPAQSKPKIWSLAETATAPDSSNKSSPAAHAHHAALASTGHPALLPGHGIYTCQIGKLHNWANAAFLNANSLLNMRSLLAGAPAGHLPVHGAVPAARRDARPAAVGTGTSGTEDDSDVESSGSFSPKRDDEESDHRPDSLKSPFQMITDRPHHGTAAQRVLTTTI